jgi:hypothetical protein
VFTSGYLLVLLCLEFGYPTVLLPVGCLNSSLASSTRSRENRLIQINVTFDSSVSLAPAGFVAAVNYVVNYFDQLFRNPVTFSIHVGYGEINGQALDPSALGESEQYLSTASYSSVRNAQLAQNAPGVSTLPASRLVTLVNCTSAWPKRRRLGWLRTTVASMAWFQFKIEYFQLFL